MREPETFLFELPPEDLKVAEKRFKERNPIWTECKAKLIERYLFYFVQITFHGTYLDAFAGPQEPEKPEMWSAKLVVESVPRWLRNFYLFESDPSQLKRIREMCDAQPARNKQKSEPKRHIQIYEGDFNQNITRMFAENPIGENEATFCLLDQRTFECDWKSVEIIAGHKKSDRKIELFYFFPEGWINRSAAGLKIDKKDRLKTWWGNAGCGKLLELRGAPRAQYVSDRFRSEFHYKHVYPFPIYEKPEQGGRVMYYMIHASDHDEAPILMNRAYGKALDIRETDVQLDLLRDALEALSLTNSLG
jgi:three-Cys-motif partner protein